MGKFSESRMSGHAWPRAGPYTLVVLVIACSRARFGPDVGDSEHAHTHTGCKGQ